MTRRGASAEPAGIWSVRMRGVSACTKRFIVLELGVGPAFRSISDEVIELAALCRRDQIMEAFAGRGYQFVGVGCLAEYGGAVRGVSDL